LSALSVYVLVPHVIPEHYKESILTLAYAILAGCFAGEQNVTVKAVAEVFEQTFSGNDEGWRTPYPYIFISVIIVTAFMQLTFLNKGIQIVDAVKFLPIYNSSMIVFSTVVGLVFYEEYRNLTLAGLLASVASWLVICGGVILISYREAAISPSPSLGGLAAGDALAASDLPALAEEQNPCEVDGSRRTKAYPSHLCAPAKVFDKDITVSLDDIEQSKIDQAAAPDDADPNERTPLTSSCDGDLDDVPPLHLEQSSNGSRSPTEQCQQSSGSQNCDSSMPQSTGVSALIPNGAQGGCC